MPDIQTLLVQVRQEAERATFPIDIPIYEAAKKDPHEPILYAGNLKSSICFFWSGFGTR